MKPDTPRIDTKNEIYSNNYWTVLFPVRPITPFHFICIVKEPIRTFTELTDAALSSLRDCVAEITQVMEEAYSDTCIGYNMFLNNGLVSVGQTLDSFHQHVFFRFSNEDVSPYTVLALHDYWCDSDPRVASSA